VVAHSAVHQLLQDSSPYSTGSHRFAWLRHGVITRGDRFHPGSDISDAIHRTTDEREFARPTLRTRTLSENAKPKRLYAYLANQFLRTAKRNGLPFPVNSQPRRTLRGGKRTRRPAAFRRLYSGGFAEVGLTWLSSVCVSSHKCLPDDDTEYESRPIAIQLTGPRIPPRTLRARTPAPP
jgi:hypothetical protein